MFQHEVVHLISDIEVFDQFTNEDFDLFSEYFQRVPFKASDVIIEEGDEESAFYIVMRGKLKVFLPQEIDGSIEKRASDIKLNILKEGDCFGEYSLIDQSPASASIVAVGEGELLKISEADFNHILASHDRIAKIFYQNVLRILIRRLRRREKEYDLILVVPE